MGCLEVSGFVPFLFLILLVCVSCILGWLDRHCMPTIVGIMNYKTGMCQSLTLYIALFLGLKLLEINFLYKIWMNLK